MLTAVQGEVYANQTLISQQLQGTPQAWE